jgi:hypothetical protein
MGFLSEGVGLYGNKRKKENNVVEYWDCRFIYIRVIHICGRIPGTDFLSAHRELPPVSSPIKEHRK